MRKVRLRPRAVAVRLLLLLAASEPADRVVQPVHLRVPGAALRLCSALTRQRARLLQSSR